MNLFTAIGGKLRNAKVSETLRRSGNAVFAVLLDSDENARRERRAFLGVVKTILSVDGEISGAHLALLRELLDQFAPENAIRLLNEIRGVAPIGVDEAVQSFAEMSAEKKRRMVKFLFDLAIADDASESRVEIVDRLARKLGFPAEECRTMYQNACSEKESRARLLRSGAGILTAIGVIVVFILMATWLRPVAFGLIGAYLLLPLEKFFERRLRAKKGVGYFFFRIIDACLSPLRKLSGRIMTRLHTAQTPDEEKERRDAEDRILGQATLETFLVLFVVLALLFSGIAYAAHVYMNDFGTTLSEWNRQHADGSPEASFVDPVVVKLNRASDRFANLPPVRYAIRKVTALVSDPVAMRSFITFTLRKSGGIFSMTAGLLSHVAALTVDFLLALFFGLFFLLKIAEFCRLDESAGKQGEYLVRTVFNGNWLPGAGEAVVSEATRLIGGTLVRLRIWVRGYLTIVLIDATVYTVFFMLVGVPYFALVGVIAGCGVLLPFLGPLLSLSFASILTLASGGSGLQLVCIVCFYLVYTGVVEQFITYPAVIGDSLGLTTLETIIVVLLGAVFAGIPGMILALPAASVAKYLVPQIYRCLETRQPAGNEKE